MIKIMMRFQAGACEQSNKLRSLPRVNTHSQLRNILNCRILTFYLILDLLVLSIKNVLSDIYCTLCLYPVDFMTAFLFSSHEFCLNFKLTFFKKSSQ